MTSPGWPSWTGNSAGLGRGCQSPSSAPKGLLVEHLQARGHVVYPVSPRIAARARERYRTASSKDDIFDAFVLADTLRHEHTHWRPLPIPSPILAEVRALTRDRDRLLATQQRTEAQLRAILEAYHPAAARLFSSIDRQITLAFIGDYPTTQAAAVVGTQRTARFLARNRYTGRVKPTVLVERLRANLLSGAPGTVAGKAHSALVFAELLELLNQQLADYDEAIALAVGRHPDAPIFASFPGVGPIGTAVLLAELGEDRAHYPTVEVLLAEAGLAPVTRASGRSCRVRFRYAANATCERPAPGGRTTRWRNRPGQRGIPASPGSRAASLPGAARTWGALDAGAVALLDRPRPLRPGQTPEVDHQAPDP
jgi:transposase